MRAHQADYPAAMLCRVLRVSESGYHAWRKRAPSARARRDAELLTLIEASHQRSDATYGAPRAYEDLAEAGHRVGRKRVARLMRAAGLVGVSKTGAAPRPKRTVPEAPQAPDLVKRDFTASAPNALWVAEIVCSQTTRPDVLTLGAGWEDVADLDLAVGHEHPVDEEQHELAPLFGSRGGQPLRHPSADRLERRGDAGHLLLPRRVAAELRLVRRERVRPLREVGAAALVLLERDDRPQVGVGEPLELLAQRRLGLPEGLAPGRQGLGQPRAPPAPARAPPRGAPAPTAARRGPARLTRRARRRG